MRVRLPAILILAVVLIVGVAEDPVADHDPSPVRLTECTPPAGLQLPVGQGVVVRCRLRGQARLLHVEFLVNGESCYVADVGAYEMISYAGADEIVSWSWVPVQAGHYTLTVVARQPSDADGGRPSAISWQVMAVPGDAPVRIP